VVGYLEVIAPVAGVSIVAVFITGSRWKLFPCPRCGESLFVDKVRRVYGV